MARISAYFLLCVLVCSNVSVSQLIKLPALLKHYHEHRQHERGIGFVDFLAMHYWCHQRHDNDDESHRKLPFKDHTIVYSVYYKSTACKILMAKPCPVAAIEHFPLSELMHHQAHLNALFKPPRTIV